MATKTNAAKQFRLLSENAPVRTQVVLAAELKTSQQNVSNWQTGKARPSAFFRALIERLYGIAADGWLLPDERSRIEGATNPNEKAA